jgi:hypothetical protein
MSETIVERAAGEAARAASLRRAAATLRGQAGTLKFHPATGQKPRASIRLTAALDALTQVLNELQRSAAQRADDAAAAAATVSAGAVRQAYAEVDQGAQFTAAAIEVLRRVLADGDGATIDAPYGQGAPRRQHPGALCTIVAERAEGLARSLESLAILTANLAT